ncbi:MFS transporter [Brevibacterium sp. CS2]|nr:MFS transporter [Brevibacterium sp. CS2]
MTRTRPDSAVDEAKLPTDIWVLVAGAFIVAIGYGIIAPVLPQFAESFGLGVTAATIVVSSFAFFRLVSAPAGGRLVNRLGERPVYVTGLLIVAASTFAVALAQTYWQLLLFRALGGLGSTMFTVSAMALIIRLAPPTARARAAGRYATAFLLGNIAGPVVGGLMAGWGMRVPFLVYAAALVAAAAVVYFRLGRNERLLAAEQAAQDQDDREPAGRDQATDGGDTGTSAAAPAAPQPAPPAPPSPPHRPSPHPTARSCGSARPGGTPPTGQHLSPGPRTAGRPWASGWRSTRCSPSTCSARVRPCPGSRSPCSRSATPSRWPRWAAGPTAWVAAPSSSPASSSSGSAPSRSASPPRSRCSSCSPSSPGSAPGCSTPPSRPLSPTSSAPTAPAASCSPATRWRSTPARSSARSSPACSPNRWGTPRRSSPPASSSSSPSPSGSAAARRCPPATPAHQ